MLTISIPTGRRYLVKMILNLKFRRIKFLIFVILFLSFTSCIVAPASANAICESRTFQLNGNDKYELWKDINIREWRRMLSNNWVNRGDHFLERAKKRLPDAGIDTPSELETLVQGARTQPAQGGRTQILLPVTNSNGDNLKVVYIRMGRECRLITVTF